MQAADAKALEDQIPHLRRYAISLTRNESRAEDLVQDCLERGLLRYHQFHRGTNLRSWLFTIMHNLHIDKCRKRKRRGISVPLEDWNDAQSVAPRQEWTIEVRHFMRLFNQLGDADRTILRLIAVEGLRYEEAAKHLAIALGTVKSRLFRARRKLRELEEQAAAPADLDQNLDKNKELDAA